jgi:pimeloyl-ACP methyl ester carboxylesterase
MISFAEYSENLKTAPIGKGLSYWEKGQGQALIFLHGALANGYTWRKVLPELSKYYRCIVPHLPLGGHQIPIRENGDLSPIGIAHIIKDLMDYKQIKSCTIIANDTGGAYAQVFASYYPGKVVGMVLSNCEGADVFPPPAFAYLRYAVRVPFFLSLMSMSLRVKGILKHSLMFGKLSLSVTTEELRHGYFASFIQNSAIRKDFKKAVKYWHPSFTLMAAQKLRTFQVRVLIVWGNRDIALFPKQQMQKLLKVFPNAQWIEINHSKTYIQEDAPEQLTHVIKQYMNRKSDSEGKEIKPQVR